MKLECLQKDLETAVEITSRVISNTATLPVLRCIIFETTNDTTLELRSTNLELGVKKTITADVKTQGSVAVPAQILSATLKSSPTQSKVSIEVNDNTCVFTIGGAKTTIKTIPLEDFPNIPTVENNNTYTIPTKTLITGVRSVLYSASTSLIKPELASVYIYQEDDNLIFVATDSFRLAEKKVLHKTDIDIPTVIMPAKNITELIRILETQPDTENTIRIDEDQYIVENDSLYVTSRIIDGSFPDYRSILPKETSTEVVMLKEDLLTTLKKVQIFSDKFGQVSLHIYPEKKMFTVSARNNDVGEVFDSLEAAITGEELDINFNYKYLLDVFQSITTDSITMTFAGAGKPLIIKGVSDGTFTYLVMPMNR